MDGGGTTATIENRTHVKPARHHSPHRVGLALVAVLVVGVLAACSASGGAAEQGSRPAPGEVAALASEAVDALDEAVAGSAGQLQEAAEVVSEAVAVGDLPLATPGVLVVGTNADFLPFAGYDDAGQLIGFDIELMQAVAAQLGVQASYLDMPFSNLTGAVTSGEVDAVIAAVTITTERDEVIDFSHPYFATSQALGATLTTPLSGIDDLGSDSVIAVLADTTGETYALENLDDSVVASYPNRAAALAAVADGSADAILTDTDAIAEQARTGSLVLLEEVPTAERYGIGMPEGTAALRSAINTALDEIISDGTYAAIFERWFPGRDVDQALSALR